MENKAIGTTYPCTKLQKDRLNRSLYMEILSFYYAIIAPSFVIKEPHFTRPIFCFYINPETAVDPSGRFLIFLINSLQGSPGFEY
jgi:hypothetical protein